MESRVKFGATTEETGKDCVHFPVMSVVAQEDLFPSQKIYFVVNDTVAPSLTGCARVDPFINRKILRGERFWALMLPGSVTDLRHEWTHPAIEDISEDEDEEDEDEDEDYKDDECSGCV